MEHWWSDTDRGGTEVLQQQSVPVLISPRQISHGLACDRTQFSGARGKRLQPEKFHKCVEKLLAKVLKR